MTNLKLGGGARRNICWNMNNSNYIRTFTLQSFVTQIDWTRRGLILAVSHGLLYVQKQIGNNLITPKLLLMMWNYTDFGWKLSFA